MTEHREPGAFCNSSRSARWLIRRTSGGPCERTRRRRGSDSLIWSPEWGSSTPVYPASSYRCGRRATTSPNVARVCARFGSDELGLLTVLRQVEVLDTLRQGGGAGVSGDAGLLMAARMLDKAVPHPDAEDEHRNDDDGRDRERRRSGHEGGDDAG